MVNSKLAYAYSKRKERCESGSMVVNNWQKLDETHCTFIASLPIKTTNHTRFLTIDKNKIYSSFQRENGLFFASFEQIESSNNIADPEHHFSGSGSAKKT